MIDFKIKRGPSSDIIIDGKPNPRLILEKGCWYLCTDTAELYLCTNLFDEETGNILLDDETGDQLLTLKQINGSHNAADLPTQSPSFGPSDEVIGGIIGAYTDEETGERYVIFTDGSELAFGTVIGAPGKDGLTVSVKVGDTIYEHVNGIIELPEVDLSNYATKDLVPVKLSDLENDSNFITISDIPEIDLTGYAKTEDIPAIPTDISVFNNDAGYLTEHQDLSEYAKKSDIPEKVDLSEYARKSEIPTVSEFINQIPSEYITETELNAKNYLTEHQSLANYATKTFVENTVAENQPNLTKYALKTDIPTISDFVTAIPAEYVTESELAANGYLTEHQSLTAYATKEFVNEAIGNIEIPEAEKVDLSNYYTKLEVDSLVADELDSFAKIEDIPDVSKFITEIPNEYVTEQELAAKGYLTEHQSLAEYAKKNELFSGSYKDLTDTPVIPSIDGLATENFVTEAIANIDIPDTDLSSYYTKIETDTIVSEAISSIDIPKVDLSSYALKSELEIKADDIPFTTNRYVSNAIGGFTIGESVRGLTVAELFAKLLGLSDVPQGVVENILANEYGLYQFNDASEVEHIEYLCTIFETAEEYASAPVESTFYQYTYTNGDGDKITESGYQHYTRAQDFIYYMVMLPSSLVIGENVKVQAWSPSKNKWMDTSTVLEGDPEVIAANFADVGLEMPVIPDGYTMWVDFSDVNPGNKVRYIIIE